MGTRGETNDTMDIIAEVQRQKEYNQILEQLVCQSVPTSLSEEIEEDLCDLSLEENYRRAMAFWLHVYIPFHQVLSFIHNNRLLHEDIPLLLDQIPSHGTIYSAETIFRHLRPLIPSAADELIHTIHGSVRLHSRLHHALMSNDLESFCHTISDAGCDLSTISYLCSHLMEDISPILNTEDDMTELMMEVSLQHTIARLSDEDEELAQAAWSLAQTNRRLNEDDSEETFAHYTDAFHDYLHTHMLRLIEYYWSDSYRFLARESAILDSLLSREEAHPLVHEMETYLLALDEEDTPDGPNPDALNSIPTAGNSPVKTARPPIGFKIRGYNYRLDSNYFDQGMDASASQEYFYCHEDVLHGGPAKLTILINYLSEQGYISSAVNTKDILAYRLTGKGSPLNLRPIQWNGKNGNPYELIYMIKHLTTRGDYRKMRRFFIGPQWVKDRDSSYAKSATYEFKKFLHQIYPTICPL